MFKLNKNDCISRGRLVGLLCPFDLSIPYLFLNLSSKYLSVEKTAFRNFLNSVNS